jgi:hypothetical protein
MIFFPLKNILILNLFILSQSLTKTQSMSSSQWIQKSLPPKFLNAFRNAALEAHNIYRGLCGVPSLIESDYLNMLAQANITKLTNLNLSGSQIFNGNWFQFKTNTTLNDDEDFKNLAMKCVESWYSEITKYDFNKPGYSYETSFYTQLVWKSTTNVGFGLNFFKVNDINYYTINAIYSPSGNVFDLYPDNVIPPSPTLPSVSNLNFEFKTALSSSSLSTDSNVTYLSLPSEFLNAFRDDILLYHNVKF